MAVKDVFSLSSFCLIIENVLLNYMLLNSVKRKFVINLKMPVMLLWLARPMLFQLF